MAQHIKRFKSLLSTEGGRQRKQRTVNAATYTLQEDDETLYCTYGATGVLTITIPAAAWPSAAGAMREIEVIDDGNCGTNAIVVDPEGALTIDGNLTATLNVNYAVLRLGLLINAAGTKIGKVL